ncbi:E3 ubiquitin-protein ligase-like [Erpetoichthys calabaricus]|uniref:E3 ubiquitin-protein ligase RNF182 n=1 Tax=Erpetoichthys calabaricus TaxID=27687 RepID=A0A8C4SFB9_ERPCA|nr:E3 ubiquitin-protein ligase-like [Erpetoichthys calabaricus]
MCTSVECGICFLSYNWNRRCPRTLRCCHTFCERCLLTLAGCGVDEDTQNFIILCPLCRGTTSGSFPLRRALRLDEEVLVRMEAAGGVLEESDEPEIEHSTVSASDDSTSGPRIVRVFRRLWRKCRTKSRSSPVYTSADFRDLALMSCYSLM